MLSIHLSCLLLSYIIIGLVLLHRGAFLSLNDFVKLINSSSLLAKTIPATQIITMFSTDTESVANITSGRLVSINDN